MLQLLQSAQRGFQVWRWGELQWSRWASLWLMRKLTASSGGSPDIPGYLMTSKYKHNVGLNISLPSHCPLGYVFYKCFLKKTHCRNTVLTNTKKLSIHLHALSFSTVPIQGSWKVKLKAVLVMSTEWGFVMMKGTQSHCREEKQIITMWIFGMQV